MSDAAPNGAVRLDVAMTLRGVAESRSRARAMIEAGAVTVNGRAADKPSQPVAESDVIEASDPLRYVGRGGLKLERALELFGVDVAGKLCLDAGASTGGFTDCLLKHGASRVVAVEHGHGQLHPSLLADPRVDSREGVDIRALPDDIRATRFGFVCADLSFISLRLTLPPMAELVGEGAQLVCLVKPQFEAGKAAVGKNGIVKDRRAHVRVLYDAADAARRLGLTVNGLAPSPIRGGSGNIEYLMLVSRGGAAARAAPEDVVREAFSS